MTLLWSGWGWNPVPPEYFDFRCHCLYPLKESMKFMLKVLSIPWLCLFVLSYMQVKYGIIYWQGVSIFGYFVLPLTCEILPIFSSSQAWCYWPSCGSVKCFWLGCSDCYWIRRAIGWGAYKLSLGWFKWVGIMKVPWRTVVRDAQVELSEKFSGLYMLVTERNLGFLGTIRQGYFLTWRYILKCIYFQEAESLWWVIDSSCKRKAQDAFTATWDR